MYTKEDLRFAFNLGKNDAYDNADEFINDFKKFQTIENMYTIKIHFTSGNYTVIDFKNEAEKNNYINYLFACNSKLIKIIEDLII